MERRKERIRRIRSLSRSRPPLVKARRRKCSSYAGGQGAARLDCLQNHGTEILHRTSSPCSRRTADTNKGERQTRRHGRGVCMFLNTSMSVVWTYYHHRSSLRAAREGDNDSAQLGR